MSDSGKQKSSNTNLPSLHSTAQSGEPFKITARASIATGRIYKSIQEIGWNWDVVASIIQESLDDAMLYIKGMPRR